MRITNGIIFFISKHLEIMKKKDLILQNENLIKENEFLNHFRDSSIGLYCIDRNPKEVSKEWIEKYAFRLT